VYLWSETRPYEIRPYGTRPYGTRPYETRPYETRPYGTRPYGTRPYETRPYETRPYETRPYGTRPYETRPYETRPYETRPYETRPYETWIHGTRIQGDPSLRNLSSVRSHQGDMAETQKDYGWCRDFSASSLGGVMCGVSSLWRLDKEVGGALIPFPKTQLLNHEGRTFQARRI
jgi:hypothetical protein